MGSRKFGAFIVIVLVLSLLIQIATLIIFYAIGLSHFNPTPGPFYFIFSLLPLYYMHTPAVSSSKYACMGASITVSEKSWIYLTAGQLLLCEGLGSMIAAGSALAAGYIYSIDSFGIQRFRLPLVIEVIHVIRV